MARNKLIVSAASVVILLFAADPLFAQGGDGKLPSKPTTPATTTATPKSTKPTAAKPAVVKKTQTTTSLKSKLVGRWEYEDGVDTRVTTYFANNTGKISEGGKVCATFTYTLSGNILVEKTKPTKQCEYYEVSENTFKIEINGDELKYFLKLNDGTFDTESAPWTRIK